MAFKNKWVVEWEELFLYWICNYMHSKTRCSNFTVSISGEVGWLQGTTEMGCNGRKGNCRSSTSINSEAIAMSVGLDLATDWCKLSHTLEPWVVQKLHCWCSFSLPSFSSLALNYYLTEKHLLFFYYFERQLYKTEWNEPHTKSNYLPIYCTASFSEFVWITEPLSWPLRFF